MNPTERIGQRLRTAREAAQLSLEDVAAIAKIPSQKLGSAEQGGALTGLELCRVAEVLGLSDVELVSQSELPNTSVGVLLRSADDRVALAPHLGRFASIMRDFDELEAVLGIARRGLVAGFTAAAAPSAVPFEQGEWLADRVRQKLGLGTAAIRSMSDLLVEQMGIRLIWTASLEQQTQGLALYDPRWGSAVVVNLRGREDAWWTTRSTIAHEVCHVLFDRVPAEPLGVVSRIGDKQETEQRANAFSVYFLAPREGVARFLTDRGCRPLEIDEYDVHALMNHFGLGKEAATWHLKHLGWIDEETRHALRWSSYAIEPEADLESPRTRPPLGDWLARGVSLERIELVELALAARHRNKITAGRLREVLGLDPFVVIPQPAA